MLANMGQSKTAPWLRPAAPSLTQAGGALLRTLSGHEGGINTVAVTPDGQFAISGSDDNTLKVWSLDTGEEVTTLKGHTDWVRSVAVTPDGQFAISGSYDNTLKVWSLSTGHEVACFVAEQPLYACAVSRDGKTIVAAGQSGRVHFLRLENV